MKYLIVLTILTSIYSCGKKQSLDEKELDKLLANVDIVLRKDSIDDSELNQLLERIDNQLTESVDDTYAGYWTTKMRTKHNNDSSVTLISSYKEWKDGFKREKILHFNDTFLVVKRFDILTENQDTLNYELIEQIEYLTKNQNIRTLLRRIFPAPLSDSIDLRRYRYEHYESNIIEPHYQDELEYAKRIIRSN